MEKISEYRNREHESPSRTPGRIRSIGSRFLARIMREPDYLTVVARSEGDGWRTSGHSPTLSADQFDEFMADPGPVGLREKS